MIDLTNLEQAIFDEIEAAAEKGKPCPGQHTLTIHHRRGNTSVGNALRRLTDLGLVSFAMQGNHRVAQIIATGKTTMQFGEDQAFFRDQPVRISGCQHHLDRFKGRMFEDMPVGKVRTINRNAYSTDAQVAQVAGRSVR